MIALLALLFLAGMLLPFYSTFLIQPFTGNPTWDMIRTSHQIRRYNDK